jgi:phospholipid-binding lipoprotein MlaA
MMHRTKTILLGILTALSLSGCVTVPEGENRQEANDPLESWNRGVFNVSVAVDKALFRPLAIAYRSVIPSPIRDSVRNILNNLQSPVIFANDVLQGDVDRAGTTLLRAGVNSTIGFGGIFDVAQVWGFPRHSEDFGQTLAVWGVGEGPYLFVPLLGPGNPRDLFGYGVDVVMDPFTWWKFHGRYTFGETRLGVDMLDLRARNIDTLDEIEKSSLDYYASIRSLYRQTRENEIRNGATQVQDLPEF